MKNLRMVFIVCIIAVFIGAPVLHANAWEGAVERYCRENGKTGLVEYNGEYYYISPETKKPVSGWVSIDGNMYYFKLFMYTNSLKDGFFLQDNGVAVVYDDNEKAILNAQALEIEQQLETLYQIQIDNIPQIQNDPARYYIRMITLRDEMATIPAEWIRMVSASTQKATGTIFHVQNATADYIGDDGYIGLYIYKSNTVRLIEPMGDVIVHEFTHAFNVVVDKYEKSTFDQTWLSYNTGYPYAYGEYIGYGYEPYFYTTYSTNNQKEDFAEVAEYYFFQYKKDIADGTVSQRPFLQMKAEYFRTLSNKYIGADILN